MRDVTSSPSSPLQEVRMRNGNKKIYHLEAWVVKVMSLYKVCALCPCGATLANRRSSISFTIWTCQPSTK